MRVRHIILLYIGERWAVYLLSRASYSASNIESGRHDGTITSYQSPAEWQTTMRGSFQQLMAIKMLCCGCVWPLAWFAESSLAQSRSITAAYQLDTA